MNIAHIHLKNNLILAPMAGITDKVFRNICVQLGAGMTFTEMVSANGLHHSDSATKFLLSENNSGVPCGAQLFGHNPDMLAEVAHSNAVESFDVIDINMGCPAKKIVSGGDGSALMRDPELIFKITSAVSKATSKPITVKLRAGFDSFNAVECALAAQEGGVSAITVHGRTREQGYSGKSNIEWIEQVCKQVNLPVIGNGDVACPQDALQMLEIGCAGIMIGRAAFGKPWIFAQLQGYFEGKEFNISQDEIREIIIAHFNELCAFKGEYTAVREMRKHLAAYVHGMKGAACMRSKIVTQTSAQGILKLIDSFFGTTE